MSSILRKPDGTLVVTVRLTLKPGRDQDIIDKLQHAPPRRLARTIVNLMRNGVSTETPDEEEEDEEVDLSNLGFDL